MGANKKTFLAVEKVRAFIDEQPPECQAEFLAIVEQLEEAGFLVEPYARKLEIDLFEIRVRRGRQIRVFYFYHEDDLIIGVHAFVKKTRRTPRQELKQARRVVGLIKRGEYVE